MSSAKADEEQLATGYPLLPQNPDSHAHLQYVQPPPPQNSDAHLQFVTPPPPPPPPPPYPSPPPQQGNPLRPTQWSSGLCFCTDDPSLCLLTFFCPCITFGRIAEIVGEGSPKCGVSGVIYGLLCVTWYACFGVYGVICVSGFASCYSCTYRTKMRAKFNLAEIPVRDCLLHFFCEPCALCEEYKELKHRGYDPALGWMKNLQKQEREMGIAMAPPVIPPMEK
ncbi:protein PLANT CADMIUM RESISTANCE 7 [Cryptomeria japonica]|uniref:protein PLANT CADMIUM RESISTANCE 7 n=1 Tax=Cryptomeria japonica TaxID=3369 RepID=UPI0027DA7FAD|nr:protein PLANT CADMIUM RESISTANCE 7 [Cryptomeria japonica]